MSLIQYFMVIFLALFRASTALSPARPPTRPSWTESRKNPSRTNANEHEMVLTPATVSAGFGRKAINGNLDGQVYGQVLYVPDVSTPLGIVDIAIVGTANNSVYALRADTLETVWRTNLAKAVPAGPTTITCTIINPQYGITGTGYIELRKKLVYVLLTYFAGPGQFPHRIYALSIENGTVIDKSARDLGATVHGVTFNPSVQNARAGLAMAGSILYASFSAYCDRNVYNGWIFGVDTSVKGFPVVKVFLTTFDRINWKGAGGVWLGGAAPAIKDGFMYTAAGNGDFDALAIVHRNWGNGILKLDLRTPNLQVVDYYIPTDQALLSKLDADQGAGAVVLFTVNGIDLLAEVSKFPRLTVLKTSDMGSFCPPDTCTNASSSRAWAVLDNLGIQTLGTSPAVWNSPSGDVSLLLHPLEKTPGGLRKLTFDASGRMKNNTLGPRRGVGSPRGTPPTVSSNEGGDALVWEINKGVFDSNSGGVTGGFPVLHVYDAESLEPLWSSSAKATDDLQLVEGNATTKYLMFSTPTVVDGRVFVTFGYDNKSDPRGGLAMFGLLDASNASST